MKSIFIWAINFYRNYLSYLKLQSCRFYPTCSQYTIEAIEKRGVTKGLVMALKRIVRCHPFSKGGYDPIE